MGVQRRFGQNRDFGPLLASFSHLSSAARGFMIVFLTLLELIKVKKRWMLFLDGRSVARGGFVRDKESTERAFDA